jgi:purine-binding chemotaxis protein CheW
MVFLLNGVRTGFVVDQVAEVLRISKHSIEPAPALSSEQGKLLSRMANLEKQKRMVQLLDPEHLVDNGHLSTLASMSDQDGSHLPKRPQLEPEAEQRRPGRGNRKK